MRTMRKPLPEELREDLVREIREKLEPGILDESIYRVCDAMVYEAMPAQRAVQGLDRGLSSEVEQQDSSFQERFFQLARNKNVSDPVLYNRAGVDRRLFSKFRSDPTYHPNRRTALRLALSLELSLDETQDLIGRAGYTLTRASRQDIIIAYFIDHGHYDVDEINDALYAFDQELL